MADPLFFSAWLKDYSVLGLPIYFRKALETFPASKLKPGGTVRVFALNFHETPLLEEFHDDAVADWHALAARAQEFLHEDAAFQFELFWDLWRWDGEWSLKPARAFVNCFGPQFDTDSGEHLCLEFPDEGLFLPNPHSDQLRPVQSNLRSLVRLASELEENLPMTRRRLWSDQHENFAGLVSELLG